MSVSPYLRPDDMEWSEPTNNDMPPTDPQPGDYDVMTYAEEAEMRAEQHEALMGGWCSRHPDRPEGGRVVGHWQP